MTRNTSNEGNPRSLETSIRNKRHIIRSLGNIKDKSVAPILEKMLSSQDGEILGKPRDVADAARILSMLSGKTHEVLTAVALTINPSDEPICLVQVSEVKFASLSSEQIAAYIASKEPFGKAGAYGIQGLGGSLIPSIRGSYSGIMGLPLFETTQLLDRAQVIRI